MQKRSFLILKTLLVLVVISESAVIAPRGRPKDDSKVGDIPRRIVTPEKDKKLGSNPGIRNPGRNDFSSVEYDDMGVNNPDKRPSDYDYGRPEDDDNSKPGIKPEIIPEEENFEPFDEDVDKAEGGGEESKPPIDEDDEKIPEDSDEEKVLPEEEKDKDEKEPGEEDDVNSSDKDDEKPSDEDDEKPSDEDDVNDKEPDDNYDHNQDEEDSGHFLGGSFFDTPFFNLNKVRKYFNQMERALEHVFRQTLDEARLLNGTYANTTEKEIVIGGKKYVVQKSIIKGADNHSSIYVETMSTKPKLDNAKGIKDLNFKKEKQDKRK